MKTYPDTGKLHKYVAYIISAAVSLYFFVPYSPSAERLHHPSPPTLYKLIPLL
jgi:hypothetical protein